MSSTLTVRDDGAVLFAQLARMLDDLVSSDR